MEKKDLDKQISEYAMALDLLGKMTGCTSEKEAVDGIIDLFVMLFSPGKIAFLCLGRGIHKNTVYLPLHTESRRGVEARLLGSKALHYRTDSETGFVFTMQYNGEPMGIVEVDDLAFVQYRESYFNLALSIADVCGLVIENARRYEKIIEQKKRLALTLKKLKKTQAQLVESEKMAALGTLVAGVAHEINTPVWVCVTAVSSMVDKNNNLGKLFSEKKMKRSDLESFIQFTDDTGALVLKNLKRAGELVSGFKQVSVDQMTDQLRKFSLEPYFRDVIRSLKPKFGRRNVQICLAFQSAIEVTSYPGLYSQILTNLLVNSFTHGYKEKEGGKIMLFAAKQKEELVIQYSDDGNGMTTENKQRIFDPFFTTNKEDGTGLGMHIVYNIVTQKLKGTISCESSPGHGVNFKIVLPREGAI
ncbi:Histidine kinase-, DNA gyrase B-, and HSP90-like ATPase [Desulfocicer vacuolatum DSM 3385]|uniref:histidine kinase n=1 Tax=Desulfocicer vacuolatum DSM 3385 TaxID=1121400 RepID=A0A1W2AKH6_9BACT|nr:HAMP domain-containing sensor histidine kinase [Desulfocicer vacuolatum]SMC61239.1 Histidine kinase-, DNA gyrase B-, and HSP90-like ATPase [Desulfocicer vacuolatum DSM 3385]